MTFHKLVRLTPLIAAACFGTAALAGGTHAAPHEDNAAVGEPGKDGPATRTVHITMSDAMRFDPPRVAVKQGETIHFVVDNKGKVKHEFVLGTDKELAEHAELMKKFPGMEHNEPNMVTVAPGQTGNVIWKFTRSGSVSFACLQPGHYDAGMKGAVQVAATRRAKAAAATGDAHAHTH